MVIINRVILTGNLTKDNELKDAGTTKILRNTLAVKREFKKDETKKVSLEIKNDSLKEEIKSFLDVLEQERKTKTFDILTRYKSFSLQDLQTVQAFVLNERKNELYQDVLSFCNQKAITISDFLTLSEKLNNTLLSI